MKRPDTPGPAYRVETARLVLRCWSPDDAHLAQPLMARSDAHLRRFIPFSTADVRDLYETTQWLRGHRALFDRDEHYRYAVFDTTGDTLLGETMLLDREQRGDREVGYWIGLEHCGQGFATEATAAMVALAFELDGAPEVTLHCSPVNVGSVHVARKLGFEHLSTRTRTDPVSPDDLESMTWALTREAYPRTVGARAPLRAYDALGRSILERTN